MTCPDCAAVAAENVELRRYWRNTRQRFEALRQTHEYLIAAWQNECVVGDRLRAELRQLKGDSDAH